MEAEKTAEDSHHTAANSNVPTRAVNTGQRSHSYVRSLADQLTGVNGDTHVQHFEPDRSTENEEISDADDPSKIPHRERIRHFTWSWFTMTMAGGGIANCIYNIPEPLRFRGLTEIGIAVFLINIALFLCVLVMITLRFYLYPPTFRASFLHPTESLFVPTAITSVGIILMNITQYGVGAEGVGEWLGKTMVALYWFHCAFAVALSAMMYLILWSTQTFTISQMTPIWVFPAYPLLIVGPHAGQLAGKVSKQDGLSILIGGTIVQGIGFMVSLMIYSAFLYRLMSHKLPQESVRPGMFVSVGPSGFTVSALISMGQAFPKVVSPDFMIEGQGELVGSITKVTANWAGLWLWGLAIWFFSISVGSHLSSAAKGRVHFAMSWYSFVFPNTALTTATFSVARALGDNRVFEILGCCFTVGVIIAWLLVFAMMIRAIVTRQILWPQKQEDRDEGGWTEEGEREKSRLRSIDPERGIRNRTASVLGRSKRRMSGASAVRTSNRYSSATAVGRFNANFERILSRDRADYAIKEAMRKSGNYSPDRGRHH